MSNRNVIKSNLTVTTSPTRDSDGHGQENSSKSCVHDAAQHPESCHIIHSSFTHQGKHQPTYQSHIMARKGHWIEHNTLSVEVRAMYFA